MKTMATRRFSLIINKSKGLLIVQGEFKNSKIHRRCKVLPIQSDWIRPGKENFFCAEFSKNKEIVKYSGTRSKKWLGFPQIRLKRINA
jgi:hypothetical protein